MDALWQDLRYATRTMQRSPGFLAAAVACLAIGIGANTIVFSFVNAFLFQPLPPGVVLIQRASGSPISYPELQTWQGLNGVFTQVFAYTPGERLTIGQGLDGEPALGEAVTGDYFRTLGILPAAGRMLAAGDESRALAVIGYHFWRNHFFGDPAIAGKTIWVNHQVFTITGVAAPTFHGMLAPWTTDVWVTPYLHRDLLADQRTGWLLAAARLKPGFTMSQAAAAMNTLDAELARRYPGAPPHHRDPLMVTRRSGLSGSPVWSVFQAMSALLMTVVGIIFLIACGNVASLLIARAVSRRREIMIRLSVGASRSRLIRQLLTESLILGLLGAAAGIVTAYAAGDALAGLLPRSISGGFRFEHGIDAHVLAFTLALSLASMLLAGLLPALRASDQNLAAAGRTQTAMGGRTPRLRQWLIFAQVAASVLVLTTAGFFIRSFQKAQAVDPGFDVEHLLTVDLDLREMRYPQGRIAAFYSQLGSRVARLPGVVSASIADALPLGNTRVVTVPAQGEVATATVDANYLRSMGIPLLRGREPQPHERDVAIVNAAFARRLFPDQDPIGKSIRVNGDQVLQIIGLTATGKYWSLTEPARPFLYQISNQPADPLVCLAIRTQGPPGSVAAEITSEIRRLDPALPAMRVQTAKERLRAWFEPLRAAAVLLSILGLAALGLAITGLYALLAHFVAQRTPEIAVRMALGATPAVVAGMLLRRSALLIFAGTAAGIAASAAITSLLASLSGEVSPLDAINVTGVVILLALVGAAATLVPAYRAVSIDPISALRAE